jgi:hypothetical protein
MKQQAVNLSRVLDQRRRRRHFHQNQHRRRRQPSRLLREHLLHTLVQSNRMFLPS